MGDERKREGWALNEKHACLSLKICRNALLADAASGSKQSSRTVRRLRYPMAQILQQLLFCDWILHNV
jgi:hypothetical protein